MKRLIPLLTLILFLCSQASYGQIAKNFIAKEDLRLSWFYFDEDDDVMLPFLSNENHSPTAIHLFVPENFASKECLKIDIPANTSLFISNKFIHHFEKEKVRYFSLDSLLSTQQNTPIQLTLYNKQNFIAPVSAKTGFIKNAFDNEVNVNPVAKRFFDQKADYYKVIILILLTFFVVLRVRSPQELSDFMSIRYLFTFRQNDTLQAKYRSLTKSQLLVIVFQAALLAAILIILLSYIDTTWANNYLLRVNPILGWLSLFGIILALIISKYILVSFISFLFGMADRINFYFIEFLRMTMVFYAFLFIFLSYVVINQFYLIQSIMNPLIYIVIIFYVSRMVLLYFKFRRTVAIKSLHLFSYLCTTELIPIMIGVNFFLK